MRRPRLSPVVLAVLMYPPVTLAGNGLNAIGFGTESVAMGGADTAVARDAFALNINPAGLVQIEGGRADHEAIVLYGGTIRHADRLGNDTRIDNPIAAAVNAAVATGLGPRNATFGVGLFAQGGSGIVYEDLITPAPDGTRDDFALRVAFVKAAAGGAFELTPDLSFGAVLAGYYSILEQEAFPDTSFDPPDGPPFFGTRIDDAGGLGLGWMIGLHYHFGDRLAFGAAYSSEAELNLRGAELEVDMSAVDIGKVTYRKAAIRGFAVPRQASIGVAFRPRQRWLLAADLTWIDWSSALATTELEASRPDDPDAPPNLALRATLDWRDQYVATFGVAYELTARWTVMGGYNHGNNPVPDKRLNPLLAPITEHHITLGARYAPEGQWRFSAALQYALPNEATYDNPELPFGPGSKESVSVLGLHAGVSYLW